jgi:hypothetical protein
MSSSEDENGTPQTVHEASADILQALQTRDIKALQEAMGPVVLELVGDSEVPWLCMSLMPFFMFQPEASAVLIAACKIGDHAAAKWLLKVNESPRVPLIARRQLAKSAQGDFYFLFDPVQSESTALIVVNPDQTHTDGQPFILLR